MEEHNGKEPQNARININYTGKKPKVSFSYPVNKKNAVSGTLMIFTMLFSIWFVINIPLLFYSSYISSKNTLPLFNKTDYNLSNYEEFSSYYTQKEKIDYNFDFYNANVFERVKESFINTTKEPFYFLIYFFASFCLIYFTFKKKLTKLYPDFMALISSKKIRKFTSKDVQLDIKGNIFIELPVFANVVCDFNATNEFSKYLKEFDIREFEFLSYKLKKIKGRKIKGRKKNEFIWYARWYFTQIPKNGSLEVIFR